MTDSSPDKLFGRYNELVLLLLGFVLTSILGGFLTTCYQSRSRLDAERTTRLQGELARATAVSEEVSRALDRRLYRTRVLVWTLKDNAPDPELQVAREEYRKAMADWNENLNRLYSSTEYCFGSELRSTLESSLAERFRSIHRSIDACVRDRGACDAAKIDEDINAFNPEIYSFDAQLLEQIKRGNIGAFRGQ